MQVAHFLGREAEFDAAVDADKSVLVKTGAVFDFQVQEPFGQRAPANFATLFAR